MILKENIRSNYYDNIIQIVKTGGLIIINNISIFDQSFLSQIIHIINDANNNKYMDRSFSLIFTLTEQSKFSIIPNFVFSAYYFIFKIFQTIYLIHRKI